MAFGRRAAVALAIAVGDAGQGRRAQVADRPLQAGPRLGRPAARDKPIDCAYHCILLRLASSIRAMSHAPLRRRPWYMSYSGTRASNVGSSPCVKM
jgi:hypothetical protein